MGNCRASGLMRILLKPLFCIVLYLATVAVPAQTTFTTVIEGVVPVTLTLSSTIADVSVIDLVNAESAILGKLTVFSNTRGIWTVVVNSSNQGRMRGITPGNQDEYPYRFRFGSYEDIDLANIFSTTINTTTGSSTMEYSLGVTYRSAGNLLNPVAADTYRDIVTITISVT